MSPQIEDVQAAARAFKAILQMRAKVTDPNDPRTCKELLAHSGVQHKFNQLLIQACEVIDDFLALDP